MFFLPLARGDAYRSDCDRRPGSAFSRPDMERFDVTRTGTSSHSCLTRHRRANGLRRHPLVAYIFFPIGCPNFLGRSGQSRLVIFRLPSLAHLGRVIDISFESDRSAGTWEGCRAVLPVSNSAATNSGLLLRLSVLAVLYRPWSAFSPSHFHP